MLGQKGTMTLAVASSLLFFHHLKEEGGSRAVQHYTKPGLHFEMHLSDILKLKHLPAQTT